MRSTARFPGGGATYSVYASPIINLDTSVPSVVVNSPAGLYNPETQQYQPQYINSDDSQWVTYAGQDVSDPSDPLTFGIAGCESTCTALVSGLSSFMWAWPGSSPPPAYDYFQVTATDQAGNSSASVLPAGALFSLFSPSLGAAQEVDCYATGTSTTGLNNAVQCTTLADGTGGSEDIPGDPPSLDFHQYNSCQNGDYPIAFSGYADPSIRRDPSVSGTSNPFGTNLWMLYSYPGLWNDGNCSNTSGVEIHLASSSTSTMVPGGTNWAAWCESGDCDDSAPATPIWPSEPFCTGSVTGLGGSVPCTYQCPSSIATACFSSHEVANFWPYLNGSAVTWYAVHLMYYVKVNQGVDTTEIDAGCLVTSVTTAGTPTALGWSLGQGPAPLNQSNECPNSLPSGNSQTTNSTLQYSVLSGLIPPGSLQTGETCSSWGEPAIMVAAAPAQYSQNNPNAIYLAASCISSSGTGQGYFIFLSQDFTSLAPASWVYWSGPFGIGQLPQGSYPSGASPTPNSLTELDWAVRADGTNLVAVATPAYVGTGTPIQYGCAAVNFDVLNVSNPFLSLVATVDDYDQDGSSQPWEQQGPSGCTYDPASNTGIVIVRHLINSSIYNPQQYQLYSLINSGILP